MYVTLFTPRKLKGSRRSIEAQKKNIGKMWKSHKRASKWVSTRHLPTRRQLTLEREVMEHASLSYLPNIHLVEIEFNNLAYTLLDDNWKKGSQWNYVILAVLRILYKKYDLEFNPGECWTGTKKVQHENV